MRLSAGGFHQKLKFLVQIGVFPINLIGITCLKTAQPNLHSLPSSARFYPGVAGKS